MPRKPEPFAAVLARLRKAVGLSQAELARKAGLSRMGLFNLERGEREPTWRTVQALADALDVPTDDLRCS